MKSKKIINLALQGGGSHGAFTWGVVDRLLEEKDIQIEGMSGTSAGGMNAAAIAQGLLKGGNKGARDEMRRYWDLIMRNSFSRQSSENTNQNLNPWGMREELGQQFLELIQRSFSIMQKHFSPYEWNPININPLRDLVEEFYDFDLLKSSDFIKVFLAATHVRSGKARIFNISELSSDVLLASSCLHSLFHAVEIEGEDYWDGGYIANPAIYPLIYECVSPDIVVIQLKPTMIDYTPKTADEIAYRHAQITFNSCLMRELRVIHFISGLLEHGLIENSKMKRVNMHVIDDNEFFKNIDPKTALSIEPPFIELLFEAGRRAGEVFLSQHKSDLGVKTSADLEGYL